MRLDQGNDNDEVRDLWAEFGCTARIRARGKEAKALKPEADTGHGGGWWRAPIAGCTVSDAS